MQDREQHGQQQVCYYLDSLNASNESDVTRLNEAWTYRSNDSKQIISECISSRPSACIRKSHDNMTSTMAHNEKCQYDERSQTNTEWACKGAERQLRLCGWVLTRCDYSIGMLEVDERFRRLGLSRLLIGAEVVRLRSFEERVRPFCYISASNLPSQRAFTSCGFRNTGEDHHWVKIRL